MARIVDVADSDIAKSLGDDFFDAFNTGMADEARFQGMQIGVWSAIMDEGSCDFCAWANDRKISVSELSIVPPAHFGCRCIIAYVEEADSEELEEFDDWENPPHSVFPPGTKKGN